MSVDVDAGEERRPARQHGQAATLLNEMGIWNPDAIDKQLVHLDTSMVRRASTRGEYWDLGGRMISVSTLSSATRDYPALDAKIGLPFSERRLSPSSQTCEARIIPTDKMVEDDVLNAWFVREVLPLERALTAYVRRNSRVTDDVSELRQDIYEHALIGARRELPSNTRAYLYTLARNHLINQAKRARVVSFEMVADLDSESLDLDIFEAERALTARDELRHASAGIDKLPPRCREVMRLRKLDGLSTQEAAVALGVSTETVRQQLKYGMKALIDHMLGGSGKIVRSKFGRRAAEEARR